MIQLRAWTPGSVCGLFAVHKRKRAVSLAAARKLGRCASSSLKRTPIKMGKGEGGGHLSDRREEVPKEAPEGKLVPSTKHTRVPCPTAKLNSYFLVRAVPETSKKEDQVQVCEDVYAATWAVCFQTVQRGSYLSFATHGVKGKEVLDWSAFARDVLDHLLAKHTAHDGAHRSHFHL